MSSSQKSSLDPKDIIHSGAEAVPAECDLPKNYIIARIAPPEGSEAAKDASVSGMNYIDFMHNWRWTMIHVRRPELMNRRGKCTHFEKTSTCWTGKCYFISYTPGGSYAREESDKAAFMMRLTLHAGTRVDTKSYPDARGKVHTICDVGLYGQRFLWKTNYDIHEKNFLESEAVVPSTE
ncbi:hypothetical protein J1614_006884 [Plenodomus biglobosus]|nr:hypothetical protein J1614_006884 [Plenodomus biglobosus]